METNIPILAEDQRVADVADRLAELNRQHAEAEIVLRELRDSAQERVSFAKRAEDLADGIEHPAASQPLEQRIAEAAERVELLAAAISVQSRRLSETRESVGEELLADLRPAYTKRIADVAAKVQALCTSLAAHDEFVAAVAAAGLPVSHALPAGGTWKRPQILHYFGTRVDEPHSLAKELFDVLAECGYSPTAKPVRKDVSHVA